MPGSLQKRGPRPCGRKGAACEGRPRASSLSSGRFAGNHRHTFGRTIPAKCIQSHRAKAVSRETLSCLCFSVWVNTLCSLLISAALQDGERLFAFLDDLYIVCKPERVGAVHELLRHWLWVHSGISLHAGKTKVWNRSGVSPHEDARLRPVRLRPIRVYST